MVPLQEQLWESMWRFSWGHTLERVPARSATGLSKKHTFLCKEFNVAKSGSISKIQPLRGRPLPLVWASKSLEKLAPDTVQKLAPDTGPKNHKFDEVRDGPKIHKFNEVRDGPKNHKFDEVRDGPKNHKFDEVWPGLEG